LSKVFGDRALLAEEEKQTLEEMQLWRDKELTILNTEDKQLTQVKNVIS
jgi:hypothetical protein